MKRQVVIYSIVFLLLQLIKSLVIYDYGEDFGKSRIEIALGASSQLTYQYTDSMEEYAYFLPVLEKRITDGIMVDGKKIELVGSNSQYAQLERIKMVDGAFFGGEAVREGRNVAIISDELSLSLYKTDQGSHNIISINGSEYEIVGVYKKYNRLRDYIEDDGYEKIYIPLTSTLVKDKNIDYVGIDGTYIEEMPTALEMNKMQLSGQTMNDGSTWYKEYMGLGQLPMIVLLCILVYEGIRRVYASGIQNYEVLKSNIPRKEQFIAIGISVAKILLFVGIVSVLGMITLRQSYIDPRKLPEENIFDMAFYWKSIRAEWVRHNQFRRLNVSEFEQAMYLLKLMIHSINIIQYVCLVKLMVKRKINKRT